MKKFILISIAGLYGMLLAQTCIADGNTFRNTKWGMPISEVKSSESLEVTKEGDDSLIYKTTIMGKNIVIAYIFVDNQLVRSKYILAETHSNKTDFISDYNDFKEILSKKYGAPKKDDKIWKSDLYRDRYSKWGLAISIGDLVLFSNWKTNGTEITNILYGDNFDITCAIEYKSTKLLDLEEKDKEKKALDAF